MRKLKAFESISVDGYFTDVNGDMSFAHAVTPDAEFAAWVQGNASGGGSLLFGRKTYQLMESSWTSPAMLAQMPVVAKKMNAAKKYVATRTLEPTWTNSERLEGELEPAVRALKEGDGDAIVILGSGSVVASLTAAGLVDELQLVVIPKALGGGRGLFNRPLGLRLVEHRAFENGNVVLTYAA